MLYLDITWYILGRHIDAVHAQRKVVEMRKKSHGAEDDEALEAIANLAVTLSMLERLEEAEAAQIQVLEARMKTLRAKHRITTETMGDLATTLYRQGKFYKAEFMQGQVIELRGEVLGQLHPQSAAAIYDLAGTWHVLCRYEEAETLMSGIADLRENALGEAHPYSISSREVLSLASRTTTSRSTGKEQDTPDLLNLSIDNADTHDHQSSDEWINGSEISNSELTPPSLTLDDTSSEWLTHSEDSDNEARSREERPDLLRLNLADAQPLVELSSGGM